MAKLKSSAGVGDLDFTMNVEPARRRGRKVEPEYPARSSRFDDFDVSADPSAESVSGTSARMPRRRRGLHWPEAKWAQWGLGIAALLVVAACVAGVITARRFLLRDPRFRVASSDSIRIHGSSEVSRDQVLGAFGEDIGRNIFYVPLAERRSQLESLPWVHHATVERLLPDGIAVQIEERVPVAFVEDNGAINLVDAEGVVLDMPAGMAGKYSFPVLTGMNDGAPDSTRTARMAIFADFLKEVDSKGEKVSTRISELDLGDPDDIVATIDEGGSTMTLHFGDQDFAARYKTYKTHLNEWKQQYPNLGTVDLRNAPQVTLGMRKNTPAVDATAVPSPAPAPTTPAASTPAIANATPAAQPELAAVPPAPKPVRKPELRPVAAVTHKPAKPQPAQKKSAPQTASSAAAKAKASPAVRMQDSDSLNAFRAQTPQAPAVQAKPALHLHAPATAGTQAGLQ